MNRDARADIVQQAHSADATSAAKTRIDSGLYADDLFKLYYFMHLTREFESHVHRLYQQGKIVSGAYSGLGNEAASVRSAFALAEHDYLFPMHRDLSAHFVKGQSVERIMLQYLGREEGLTRGRDGTAHYVDPKLRIYGNISHLGAMVPVAVGVALADAIRQGNDSQFGEEDREGAHRP